MTTQAERQKDKKMRDNEQDILMTLSELLRSKTGEGGQWHQDFLIYGTQWFIDLDDLLILDEYFDIGATFILDDLVPDVIRQ